MRHRTHAFRRAAAAAVLGMGMTAAVVGLSAGIAGAATSTGSITAASAPGIPTTGTNLVAGNLTVTVVGSIFTSTHPSTVTLELVTATGGGTAATWYATPTISSSGVNVTPATTAVTGPTLSIHLGPIATGHTATLTLTNVRYNTTTALGTVTVFATWTATATSLTPPAAVNAYATHVSPPSMAPGTKISVAATSTPYLKATGAGQEAGNWTITFTGVTKTTGWNKTETISLAVGGDTNCSSAFGYVVFTGTPTAAVSATNVTVTPTVKVATSASGTCAAVSHDQVTVTFTNTGKFTSTTASTNTMTIVVSGAKYDVHKGSGTTIFGTVFVKAISTAPTGTALTFGSAANGKVAHAYVTANTPAVTVAPNAYDASISPVEVVENTAGYVGAGYVCMEFAATSHVNASATATASAAGGNGTVTAAVFYENVTGTKVTSGSAEYAVFEVTGASTTASTYVVSGLAVNASGITGITVIAAVFASTSPSGDCKTPGTLYGTATAFTIATTSTQIAGATAAGTAAKELETTFNPTTLGCVGGETTTRPVVLATETHFQDALASQYLAGYYTTGTLLTQTSSLPSVTVAALRAEGVTRVFVVGGTLAVSSTVVNQLKALPVYSCGGSALTLTLGTGSVSHIQVTRIYGHTAEETAMAIAQAVPEGHIASLALAGAYAGVNATGGNGMYNDTPAKASTAPATSGTLRTAIVASATEFQDAMAASALAYSAHTHPLIGTVHRRMSPADFGRIRSLAKGVPILLTTPAMLSTAAADALVNLTVQQVVLMGGTAAVSNQVVTGLQAMGISVLRVAGKSDTDTAVQFAKFLVNTRTMTLGVGWAIRGTVTVTRGNGYTDGLAGAVISGHTAHPLLLTESPTQVGPYLTAFLKASGATTGGIDTLTPPRTITSLIIFGGMLAVTPAVVAQMQADIG